MTSLRGRRRRSLTSFTTIREYCLGRGCPLRFSLHFILLVSEPRSLSLPSLTPPLVRASRRSVAIHMPPDIADPSFLCALPPTLRPQWGQRMTELSKNSPSTRLITLQFPLQGNPLPFGPPFSLEESDYRDILGDNWVAVYDEEVAEGMRRKAGPPGKERLVVWKRK